MDSSDEQQIQDQLDAGVFRRFLSHLEQHPEVQNIDLMILANFCRNCLSKWYLAEAKNLGIEMTDDQARERIYGMPYLDWKDKFQLPATKEQMQAYQERKSQEKK